MDVKEMMKDGGSWLGAARNWLQWNKYNGSKVTWGSDEIPLPHMTVKNVEDVAKVAAEATYKEVMALAKRLAQGQRCRYKAPEVANESCGHCDVCKALTYSE